MNAAECARRTGLTVRALRVYERHGLIEPARSDTTIPASGATLALSRAVDALIRGAEQHSESIGLRWDMYESISLKLQFDNVEPERGGLFTNVQAGFHGPVRVVGLAADFVF